jgi:hypothetical protein
LTTVITFHVVEEFRVFLFKSEKLWNRYPTLFHVLCHRILFFQLLYLMIKFRNFIILVNDLLILLLNILQLTLIYIFMLLNLVLLFNHFLLQTYYKLVLLLDYLILCCQLLVFLLDLRFDYLFYLLFDIIHIFLLPL